MRTLRKAWRALATALLALSLLSLPVAAGAAGAKKSAVKVAKASPGKAVRSKQAARTQPALRSKQAVRPASRATRTARADRRSAPREVVRVAPTPPTPSVGMLAGLHETADELDLKSSVALVIDQDTDEVLLAKNTGAVLPIASITKLMTALVVTEARLPLDEVLTVTPEDAAVRAGSSRQLRAGAQLTRGEMLHLALMASENRAAHILGRSYPGGLDRFVEAMNAKARLLGMHDTRYVEPTGLSSDNRSSAHDLALLVRAASAHPLLRELSTSPEAVLPVGSRQVQFRNTNGLVRDPEWDIGLQKTGYIAAAGRCLVMQTQLAGRKLIMVLLDSAGRYSRIGDAERIRKWLVERDFGAVLPVLGAGVAVQPR